MHKCDFGMDSLIDFEFTECMNMCRTEKGREGKMERDRKKDKAECEGRIFEERENIWQKNSEGKTVKRDAKLRCTLAPAIGKHKDNQNQAILLLPLHRSTRIHTHHLQNTSPLSSALRGRYLWGVSGLKTMCIPACFVVPPETNKTVVFPRVPVCARVWPLRVLCSHRKWYE